LSAPTYRYFQRNLTIDSVVDRYRALFESVLGDG
jgi:hypothetical protein